MKDSCPKCGKEKDKRAALCRACRPGRAPSGTGRHVQFWLGHDLASRLEARGGDAWAKEVVIKALEAHK